MNISCSLPPNYGEIRRYFPSANFEKGTVFTYGDTCFCERNSISPDLMVHEETHSKQQDGNPEGWWRRYFVDADFRLSQETEAYHNQWAWIRRNIKDRNLRFRMLLKLARDFSGDLYGNITTFEEARKLITGGPNV